MVLVPAIGFLLFAAGFTVQALFLALKSKWLLSAGAFLLACCCLATAMFLGLAVSQSPSALV
jgi:hypothetical protein